MEIINNISQLAHHRSKKRIRDFGEVFTPKKYVQQMLDMLDRSVWTDTRVVFFEPTCGHGNFVSAIVERRLKALFKKAKRQKIVKPHFYAVANTLNNLWAIDIDPQNIEFCRRRVFDLVCRFLWEQTNDPVCKKGYLSYGVNSLFLKVFIRKHKEFLAHVLCCLEWQIQENEALSCLTADLVKAKKSADKTAVSRRWFKKNGHHPIDFKNTWCQYFQTCQLNNTSPIQYKQNLKFLNSLVGKELKNEPQKLKKKMFTALSQGESSSCFLELAS